MREREQADHVMVIIEGSTRVCVDENAGSASWPSAVLASSSANAAGSRFVFVPPASSHSSRYGS
jgi:hypothetical protein